eukprot:TRINITY_DN50459_c0_g1_i1.p1 TRINITY_DN50459_c0_g1~~TRINITY_DN50459_c0_g1_i1.p1  ORF type:complete len:517 (+),score=117.32 TRINITY_DN50459_c0_g1_i1:32-1582(+)
MWRTLALRAALRAATSRGLPLQDIPRLGSADLGRAARRSLAEGDLAEDRWAAYAGRAEEIVGELRLDEAARLAAAFSTARQVDFPLFVKLSARVRECLQGAEQQTCSEASGAWKSEEDHGTSRVSASDLRRLAIAFGRAQAFDGELMEAMVPLITDRVEHFRPRELVHIADSYARMPVQSPELFGLVAEALPPYLYDLEPPELASLCRSFAEAAIYNEELIDALGEEARKRVRSFGAFECLVFLDGLSRLYEGLPEDLLCRRKEKDSATLAVMTEQLGASASSLSAQDLVRAFAALVRLDHYSPRLVHGRLCPALALKLGHLTQVPSPPAFARPPQAASGFNGLAELLHCLSLLPAQSQKSVELALETSRCLVESLTQTLKLHQTDLERRGAGTSRASHGSVGRLPDPRAVALAAAAAAQLGQQGREEEELVELLGAALTGRQPTGLAGAENSSNPSATLLSLASEEELEDLERAFGLCSSPSAAGTLSALAAEREGRQSSAAPSRSSASAETAAA